MRNVFREYFYEPDESLLGTAVIVLDTNVLLHLFRMSVESREDLLKVLQHELISARLWMPHQVGMEFFRNKDKVVNQFRKEVNELRTDFSKKFKELGKLRKDRHERDKGKDVKGRSRLDLDGIERAIQEAAGKIDSILKSATHELSSSDWDEDVLEAVMTLYEGRVASAPSDSERSEAIATGQQRYRERIPPGYLDLPVSMRTIFLGEEPPSSNAGNPYGDYLIWREILGYAKQSKQAVLFVTADTKEDWWHQVNEKIEGPRKELIKEFLDVTGQDIAFYTPNRFYAEAARLVEVKLADRTTEELHAIEQQDARTKQLMDRVMARSVFDGVRLHQDQLDHLSELELDVAPWHLQAALEALDQFRSRMPDWSPAQLEAAQLLAQEIADAQSFGLDPEDLKAVARFAQEIEDARRLSLSLEEFKRAAQFAQELADARGLSENDNLYGAADNEDNPDENGPEE